MFDEAALIRGVDIEVMREGTLDYCPMKNNILGGSMEKQKKQNIYSVPFVV
ncbi:hypothetical protein [Oceanobacillus saliphilus]|uniref:hypothetical protein n=1 Tax=Oceanobacillus saliphilus TaxID=2925834 RepID=UPI00201D5764|nr:hypothetical protein [Oceanobacillus saliphilus]